MAQKVQRNEGNKSGKDAEVVIKYKIDIASQASAEKLEIDELKKIVHKDVELLSRSKCLILE